MGIFNLFRKNESEKHELDNTDRETSLRVRRNNAEIKELEMRLRMEEMRLESEARKIELEARIATAKRNLEELQDEDEEEAAPDNINSLILLLASKFLGGGLVPQTSQSNAVPPTPLSAYTPSGTKPSLSDDQIESMYSTLPENVKKIAKNFTDDQIKEYLNKNGQSFDDDTIQRIIKKVKNS